MRARLRLALACAAVIGVAACSGNRGKATTPAATGRITVLAAGSLSRAFEDVRKTLESANKGLAITYAFGGSDTLVAALRRGAPGDVVATGDEASMQQLVAAGLVKGPVIFASNTLELIVPAANRKNIASIEDLTRPGVITVRPTSNDVDARPTVAKVITGEADAAIVYRTEALAAGDKAARITIPDARNTRVRYVIAIAQGSKNPNAAAAFFNFIVEGAGRTALIKRGFLGPS